MNVRMTRLVTIGARCLIAVIAILATVAFSYLLLHPEQRGDPPERTTPSQPTTTHDPTATHSNHLFRAPSSTMPAPAEVGLLVRQGLMSPDPFPSG